MKNLDVHKFIEQSVQWLKDYAINNGRRGYVIGVSGGIDSAVASTLCAKTGLPLTVIEMPIYQGKDQVTRAQNHINWLKENFEQVKSVEVDLTKSFDSVCEALDSAGLANEGNKDLDDLGKVNTRSRLRMIALYHFSTLLKGLVCGTGNKVEDFGIGFFTRGGDGMVDLSPIADIMKSEVYLVAEALGINQEIIDAAPTDGLWDQGHTDEDQIGASYDELEWAMERLGGINVGALEERHIEPTIKAIGKTDREREILKIYIQRHRANQHKMNPIPVFDASGCRK